MEVTAAAREQLVQHAVPYLMGKLETMELPDQSQMPLELPLLGASVLDLEGGQAKVCFGAQSSVDVEVSQQGVMLELCRLEAVCRVGHFRLCPEDQAGLFAACMATHGTVRAQAVDISVKKKKAL